jgi:hypothetical protein
MRIKSKLFVAAAVVCLSVMNGCQQKNAEVAVNTSSSTPASNTDLLRGRATQAVIWGMPAVNYDIMLQEMLTKTPGKVGQVIYWGRPLDFHNQTLTPNPDALYFMVFYNTKDGPVVLDLPSGDENGSFNGNIVTTWQMPLEDAGLLGYDQGKGGKYLVLPPGYKDKAPAGYIPLQSNTLGGYMLFRANFKSHADADVQSAINYGKRMKVYPLSAAAHPAETVFSDVKDIDFDSTIEYDARYFDHLNNIVQNDVWLDRDRVMIDMLASLGIEKGKPYQPTEQMKSTMNSAAQDARAFLYAKYDAGFPPYFSATNHWMYPTYPALVKAAQSSFMDIDTYPVDDRGVAYSYAFIGLKRLGVGQMYLISIKDKDGNALDGAKTYKISVPPNAPVKQYWSITAYDRDIHTLIKGVNRASRSSQISELQKNADGSVDIYVGPKAPDGKDSNWIPTDANRKFEWMFRAYGPTEAFLQKSWVVSDAEKVQ